MQKTILLFLLVFICFSCGFKGDLQTFSIGDDFVQSKSNISEVDSFTVNLSTVLVDSLTTSGNTQLWAGTYTDNELGVISSTGYYELGIPDIPKVDENDYYDSLMLVMSYQRTSFGDTTLQQNLNIYRVTQPLNGDENGDFWNKTSVAYDPLPIGKISFKAKPSLQEKLKIRLSDQIGRDFLTRLKAKDDAVSSFSNFREYFMGIAIGPGNPSSLILSFPCDTTMNVELHTHRKGIELEPIINKFPVGSAKTVFNHFTADRTNTAISSIRRQLVAIPSAQSGNKTYLQSGIGLMTKVDFPTMAQLLETDKKYVLLKAELIMIPEPGTYRLVSLPTQLVLYHSDKSNRVVSEIVGNQNAIIAAELQVDRMYNESTFYRFDITDFLNTELSDNYFDTSHGLLIGETSSSIGATLDRVVFSDRKNSMYKPVVKLYFLQYNL
jgi:hypothetical protein